ncbi:MAG: polymer-forming cytoskeletal protein [Ignavibacteria bacterium]|nr:polymer-forming cytoskeletal protein [Ignavibacteria bacterium]
MKRLTSNNTDSATRNIIGQGTLIKGDIELNGDFRIDGQLVGSIVSSGKIVVGASGSVQGNITCQNADISGLVNGKLIAEDLTSFKATSVFEGDLTTSRIAIEVGAKFNGKCEMKETATNTNDKK